MGRASRGVIRQKYPILKMIHKKSEELLSLFLLCAESQNHWHKIA